MKRPLALLCSLLLGLPAVAVSITGADWIVHFNLPDQSTSFGTPTAEEFAIRDALIGRLNALQSNQVGTLATYTFSGSNAVVGGSGPVLNAMEAALNRGAKLRMVLDFAVNPTERNGGSNSLAGLAARPVNPLLLVQATNSYGIMHEKIGLFDYGAGNRWTMFGSWNFTAAACAQQWNIMLEVRNEAFFAAVSNEMAELLGGRFHYDTAKSHAQDRSAFTLADSWSNGWVRFSPPTNFAFGQNHALTDITNRIAAATQQIVFALNDCTRTHVASQLIAACNRGVLVDGVMPDSDTGVGGSSATVYGLLTNAANFSTTNRIRMWPARTSVADNAFDAGEFDLIHAKWMAIDPWGSHPVVINGSANWSASALTSATNNDEIVAFLFHRDISRQFYAHFKRITGAFNDTPDFWMTIGADGPGLWSTDTNGYRVSAASSPTGGWAAVASSSNRIGTTFFQTILASGHVFRVERLP